MKDIISVGESKRQRKTAWLLLALSMCFMLCVFTPMETYILNISEFWYGLGELVPLLLVFFLVCFLLAWAVYFIFSHFRYFYVIFTFGFFVFLGLYIQGNYIPRPYGIFDGRQVEWSSPQYSHLALASILIIAAIGILTVLSSLLIKRKIYMIASFVCGIILFSQCVTLGFLGVQNASEFKNKGSVSVITTDGVLDLSESGRNIVVFLFDTFEGTTMSDLLETDYGSKISSELTGFTFYPDTVGCYPLTACAVPYILEGSWYTNDTPREENIRNAYQAKPQMYQAFEEADYSVGVYIYSTVFLSDDDEMYINTEKARYTVNDNFQFFKYICKMMLYNYAPHQMKSRFVFYTGDLNDLRSLPGKEIYSSETPEAYSYFKSHGLRFTDPHNSFRFYYTDGVHQSYTFDENLQPHDNMTDIDESKGCLHFLSEYVAELKANGKYDDTAIIVMADHSDGWGDLRGSNPLFMVKTFNNNSPFEVSATAVSYEDLQATFSSLALDEVLPGSIWSEEIGERTERRFLYYQPQGKMVSNKGYFPTIREYMVRGFAGDPDSMELTGMIYEPQNSYYDPHYYAYTLGEKLLFDKSKNSAMKHAEYGISVPAKSAASRGRESQMCFDIGADCGDLRISLSYKNAYRNAPQRVLLTVNGVSFGEIQSEEIIHVSGDLIKEDGLLKLHFDYPDATTSEEQTGGHGTYLRAVNYRWILIERDT